MDEHVSEFLKSLRDEVIHHKDKRTAFVLQKLISVAALFGLGTTLKIGNVDFTMLLFVVPFVSLALDVYIFAEDYKVKRVGAFFRIYRYAAPAERNWERFVERHREPIAVWASFVLTVIAAIASGLVLFAQYMAAAVYWGWVGGVVLFTLGVFLYYRDLLNRLPTPHLLERHMSELLAAPGEDHLLDRLAIALILNTGVTQKELLALKWQDLNYSLAEAPALWVRGNQAKGGRRIPYRQPEVVMEVIEKVKKPSNPQTGLIFGPYLGKPMRLRSGLIDRVLRQYPIVVEGAVQTVKAEELRRTYARCLYDEGDDLKTIQQKLGCTNVDQVLGFIGPLEVQREARQQTS